MAQRYLLAIDGGGIRGIIPVVVLMKLERTTGKLARDIFSFVAGTSTGAIIAAAIAAGIPAERILNLYITRSRDIFTKGPLNLPRRIIFGSMYSTQKLHDVIGEELGPACDWIINNSPIDILVTAKRVADGMPWYFVRDKVSNSGRTGRLPLVDCVTASAAAPTYFQPWTIPEDAATLPPGQEPVGTLVDGGVGVAGNPVYQACVEAFYYSNDYTPEETIVVSLGTGRFIDEKQPSWIWSWLGWLLGELLRSPGEQQTEIVERHFARMFQMPFYRLDPELRVLDPTLKQGIGLDDVQSVERLRRYGELFATLVDWEAILEGTDTTFRVGDQNTLWYQYSQP